MSSSTAFANSSLFTKDFATSCLPKKCTLHHAPFSPTAIRLTKNPTELLRSDELRNSATTPKENGSGQKYCRDKRAFAIIDSIENKQLAGIQGGPDPALTDTDAGNSALCFSWVTCSDPLQENQTRIFLPVGFVAGIYARTDGAREV